MLKASDIRPGEHVMIARLFVGRPPRSMLFEVRFDVADIVIYGDQSVHSGKHVRGAPGPGGVGDLASDVVFFGSVERRVRLLDNTQGPPPGITSPLLCRACSGILGLRADADIWRWWPVASFTAGAITFGARAVPLGAAVSAYGHEHAFACESPHMSDDARFALCVAAARGPGNATLRALIAPSSPYVSAPRPVRDAYLVGKNIYTHSRSAEKRWNTLDVELVGMSADIVTVSLRHDDLAGRHGSEAHELLLGESVLNNTIVLGSALLWQYAMYMDHLSGTLVLREHAVAEHVPLGFAVLYVLATVLLLRFKMVLNVRHYGRPPRDAAIEYSSLAFEIAGWIVAVVAISLAEVRGVLIPDYTALYALTATIVVVGVLVGMAARLFVYVTYKRAESPVVTTVMFHVLLVESMWYEAILYVALWITVVPRRREGISNALTAFAAAWALFTMLMYVVVWASFMGAQFGHGDGGRRRRRTPLIRVAPAPAILAAATGAGALALVAYFGTTFVFYFTAPLIRRVGMIYANLALPAALVMSAILLTLASEMAATRIARAVALHARARIEATKTTEFLAS
jgi:hypothetical protein